MKKIILVILGFIIVFIIYLVNIDNKVYVVSIGDSIVLGNSDNNYHKYISKYLNSRKKLEKSVVFKNDGDYRIIDLINDINNNKEFTYNNNSYTINNVLVKADLTVISIGMNDLLYNKINNNYDYIDEVLSDLNDLLFLIRKYNKEKIYMFNYYDIINNDVTGYVNGKLKTLALNYDVNIIDISNIKNINNYTELKSYFKFLDKLY